MALRIVTDSTCDLPPELVAQHRIAVVPLVVLFGDEALQDGVDISSERFFRRLVRESKLPTTSQPAPAAFRATYERLREEGATEILSIHISGKLSRTLESARQAAEGLDGVRVVHVDSELATLALGMGVVRAAEAVAAGCGLDEAADIVRSHFRRTHCLFLVDTLEYLRRGGRIGRAQEIVGSLLKVKPILSLEGGEVVPVGRARTKQRAVEEILRRAAEFRPVEQMMAVHATTPEDLKYLVERLHGLAPQARLTVGRITPVIGVHAGPGLLACAVVTAESDSLAPPPEA
ncbi:MAG TPA: DegV family protein [Dehalococcoidia bacterium]|nr:DegV family protein [Dehalococcoidia bacterium]